MNSFLRVYLTDSRVYPMFQCMDFIGCSTFTVIAGEAAPIKIETLRQNLGLDLDCGPPISDLCYIETGS